MCEEVGGQEGGGTVWDSVGRLSNSFGKHNRSRLAIAAVVT